MSKSKSEIEILTRLIKNLESRVLALDEELTAARFRLAEWADYPERVVVMQQQIALLETVNAGLEQELELERVNAGRAEDRQGDDAAEAAEVEGML